MVNESDEAPVPPSAFAPRRRRPESQPGSSSDIDGEASRQALEELAEELDRIERRLDLVASEGKDTFTDGSVSFDRASMAIIRLAALVEDDKRFSPMLATTTDVERRGIAQTRNLIAHVGYAALNEDVFWDTATIHAPAFIQKIRSANGI